MTEPIGPPVASQPIGSACPKCGHVHNPKKCKGHKKTETGLVPCGAWPLANLPVCGAHGGRAPRSKAAAEQRGTEEKIRKTLGRIVSTPVTNPFEDLLALAGKAKAWMGMLETHVAELERLRYSSEGGEHIRGEIILFERAIEQCRKILVDVARLDIDSRFVALTDGNVELALRLVDAILRRRGIDPNSPEVRADKAAEITAMTSGQPVIEGRLA